MSEEYGKPAIAPLAFDFENADFAGAQTHLPVSGKDVLGIVQSAFEELGAANEGLIAVKRQVLAEVAEGRIAHALRTAIIGAGKASCRS
jgi:hypothetical protein